MGFADRILVSKKDLVNDVDYAALHQRLVRINPRAPITPVHFGEADLKSIIDISGFNLNSILDIDPAFLADEHPTPPTTIMTTTMATTTAMSTIMITKASAGPIATITTIITTPTTMTKSARSCSARTSPSIQPGWKNSLGGVVQGLWSRPAALQGASCT